MPEDLLVIEGIDVAYGHVPALRNVSLNVVDGEVLALVGANGAGKSTTLRAISGLQRPTRGSITFDGERIDAMKPEDIVGLGIAHLPEGRGIFPSLTVEENLKMGAYQRRRDRAAWSRGTERVTALFPRLKERWTQEAGTLSGGEQQMLALARALIAEPRLLMVDELSLGLAPVVVQQLFQTVREINGSGTTVLLVEQYVNLAAKIATRAAVLEKGTVTAQGDAADLLGGDIAGTYLGSKEVAASGTR